MNLRLDSLVSRPEKKLKSKRSATEYVFVEPGLVTLRPQEINMSPENQWLEDVFPIKILPS